MEALAEGGLVLVGLLLLLVAIGWTGSGIRSAVFRNRVRRTIAVLVVLALVVYFGAGLVLETVG